MAKTNNPGIDYGMCRTNIDKETGKLATPGCPKTMREAFLAGSEPTETCPIHR